MKVFSFLLASKLHLSLESKGFISALEFDAPRHAIRELASTFNCPVSCCVGNLACTGIAEFGGNTTVENNSCLGPKSCYRLGRCYLGGSCKVTVDEDSCEGEDSCNGVGDSDAQDAESDIGKNSCKSKRACKRAGYNGLAIIDDESCIGERSCDHVGSLNGDYTGDPVSSFYVGKKSCNADNACEFAANIVTNSATTVTALNRVEIANNSCNAVRACNRIGSKTENDINKSHNIKIGSNSCNCVDCCVCLTGSITVPDESCNSKGTGSTQCCKENNEINGDYDPYTLPVYNVSAPNCSADTSGASAVVNIICSYEITIPTGLNKDAVASFIRDYSQCSTNNADVNNTENISLTSELTGENNETYTVVIQVTPDDAKSTAEVRFCLHSEVRDDQLHVMKYHGQLIDITFDYTTDFELNLTSKAFDGFNETTAELGTVDFDVSVYRCTSDKDSLEDAADGGGPLTINDPLYVCIESKADDIVVNEITIFTLKKDGDNGYNAVLGGVNDFNTFVKDKGTYVVQVGTRPQASLFNDNEKIIVQGSAVLGSAASSDRYLARFAQEITDDTATTGDFEMQVEVIKAVSAADTVATGISLKIYGTMIGVFVVSVLF